jgi:hypothetical protein
MSVEVPIHKHIETLRTQIEGVEQPSLDLYRRALGTDRRTRLKNFRFNKYELQSIIKQYGNNIHGLLNDIQHLQNELKTKNDEFKTQASNSIKKNEYVRHNTFLEQDYNDAVMQKAYKLRANDTNYVKTNNNLHALHEAAKNIIRMHDYEKNGYIEIKPDSVNNPNGGRL